MLDPTLEADIKSFIELQTKAGFLSHKEIAEECYLEFHGDHPDDDALEYTIRVVTAAEVCLHEFEQNKWHETDCDKLDEAFAALDRMGILTRQNLCCQPCGHDKLLAESFIYNFERDIFGYAFTTEGDVKSAIHKNYLYIAFGSPDPPRS